MNPSGPSAVPNPVPTEAATPHSPTGCPVIESPTTTGPVPIVTVSGTGTSGPPSSGSAVVLETSGSSRLLEGRRSTFEETVAEHGRSLSQLAFFLCRDKAASEDLVAEAFARTWPKWREGQVDDLIPYLRRIIVHLAQRGQHRQELARRYEEQFQAMFPPASPHERLASSFDLARAVLHLPLEQRTIILLRYFQDLSEAEVSDVLGLPRGTVKSRTSRALLALRHLCGEQFHD